MDKKIKRLDKVKYSLYVNMIKDNIRDIKEGVKMLETYEIMSKITYEDWVKIQNGNLKIEDYITKKRKKK